MRRNNYNKDEVIDSYRTGRTISIIIIIILIFVCNNLWKDNRYILNETNEYLQSVKKLTDENIILRKQLDSLKIDHKPEIKREIVKTQKTNKTKKQEVKEIKENKVEQPIVEQPVVLNDTLK